VLIALLLLATRADRISHGQSAVLATRGVEEVGRSYIGEPLSAYIGHMAMLFVTGKHPTVGNGTMQDTVDWVNDPLHSLIADGSGGLAVYAHPDAASRVTLLNGLAGMELFNQGVLPSAARDQMWDTVLNTYASQGQPLIWAFAADDTHYTINPGTNFNLAWNVSLLPSVDLSALKHALRTGAFYPTNGPAIKGISVSGTAITLNLGQSSDVLWLRAGQYDTGASLTSVSQSTAPGGARAVKKDKGVTSSRVDIASLGLLYPDIRFVRAVVRATGSTSKEALTQPFAISAAGAISNPYPASGTWVTGQSHNHVDAGIGDTTSINTYRAHYQAVGQIASFETAYSYWESPYQHPDGDGFPDVASVSPAKIPCGSPAAVTVTGVNFVSGATVQLGAYPLLNVLPQTSTTLTATVPADVAPGVYDVVVTSPNTYRGTLAMGLTVQDCAAVNDGWTTFAVPSLPWDQTTSVLTTGDEVWVGTMKGAARYKNGTWSQFIPSGGLNITSRGIYDIAADPSGAMWFSSAGMWFRNAQGDFPWQWQSVDSKTSDRWGRMAFDQSGQLWATSRWGEGIAVRNTSGRWTRITNGLPNLDNQAITRDAQGNMWVGFNAGAGIWKWNGSNWQNVPVPGGMGTYASALVTGRNGDIWAAVHPMNIAYDPDKSGVVRFIGGNPQATEIYKAPLLPHPRVTDIVASRNGDVWFSSRAGVSRLNTSGEWQTFTTRNSGLVSDIVMAMAEDRDGHIWFATDRGVSALSPFDFALSNTGDVTAVQNSSGATGIVATLIENPAAAVAFTVSGLPSGAAAAFSSISCTPSCTTVVTIQAAKSSVPGTYPITVTGTSDDRVRTTSLNLIVEDSNHKPVLANPGTQTSAEGADVALDLHGTDQDGDTLRYTAEGLPAGLVLDALTGRISGTVAFGAAPANSVTITVSDGALTATAPFIWSVTHTNRAPVANPASVTMMAGTAAPITLTGSDPDNDALAFRIVTPPAHGAVAGIGASVIYTPLPFYAGADSFTFKANDGALDSAAATVSVTITPIIALAATFIYPADHAANVDLTQPITWTPVADAQSYYLYLGTSLGAKDVVNSGELQTTSYRAGNAPPDVTLYARLWTKIAGVWRSVDISFSAAPGTALTFIYPPPGVTSADMRQPFRWAPVASAQAYFLYVGTAPGKKDLVSTGEIQTTSYLATGLPLNQPLYARLWVKVANVWSYIDRTITATATVTPTAQFITPTNGATNVNLAQPIQWTSVANAQAYYLYVGSSSGAKDLLNSGELAGTSYLASNLPSAQLLYARLWTKVAGAWTFVDITFTASVAPIVTATVTAPPNGATDVDPSGTLQWTAVPDAQKYYVYIGSTPGARDLIDSGEICPTCKNPTAATSWNLSAGGTAPGLGAITTAQTVFVRLWTMVGNVWRYSDSSFTTAAR